jgi:protein phosphatase
MTDFEFDMRPIDVAVFGRSNQGILRPDNQDDFLVADLSGDSAYTLRADAWIEGPPAGRTFPLGRRGALLLVADGMGGPAGVIASRLASKWIHDELAASWTAERSTSSAHFAALLRHAVEVANARIHEQARENPELHGMGTTATVVGILDAVLYIAQVGDSRAYLVRGGSAVQLTRDQSMVQALIDAGTMTESEAERSNHRNTILQALGTGPTVDVDLTYQEARRGDVLVVCSDGLYKLVNRDEIAGAVADAHDLAGACDRLVALANERGGPDNITVVIARLDGAGLHAPVQGEVVRRNVLVLPET